MHRIRLLLITLPVCVAFAPLAHAHPVPRENHDRHITVRLAKTTDPNRIVLRIDYRLEVDELTVVLDDMRPYKDEVDPTWLVKMPLKYYEEFARLYSGTFAENLLVKANGKPLELKLKKRSCTLRDEKNEPLNHLRCDFVYEAELPLFADKENVLRLHETNYRDQEGLIFLNLVNEAEVKITRQDVPPGDLNKVDPLERKNDHERKLRNMSVHFVTGQTEPAAKAEPVEEPPKPTEPQQSAGDPDEGFLTLFRELRQQGAGLFLLLLLFAALGAAHALTPGHGKTLVAAYLVGERGTVWHAIVLGLVTTLTHTGVVLILAALLFFLPATAGSSVKDAIRTGLGLGMGLLVACLGFWLLLQRLAGQADHIHVGGGHHHHHHGDHHHDDAAPALAGGARPDGGRLGWSGIVLLGMTGGLVPCWDAVVILLTVAGTSEFWFALPALLAFSAGLAGVLVAIGILVVKFRNFAGSRWGNGRLVKALPIVSACLITAMGLWLCFESTHHR